MAGIPLGEIALKIFVVLKHVAHADNAARFPLGNVAVESAVFEHGFHAGDVGNIDLVQIAVGAVIGNFGLNKDL